MREHESAWHVQAAELALCSDVECGAVFLLSRGVCPACAGSVFTGLAAIVNRVQSVEGMLRSARVHCQTCGHRRDAHGPEGCEIPECPCIGYLNRIPGAWEAGQSYPWRRGG